MTVTVTASTVSSATHAGISYRPAGQRAVTGCPVRLIPRRHLVELRRRYRQARPPVSAKVSPLQARVQARISLVGFLSEVSERTITADGESIWRAS